MQIGDSSSEWGRRLGAMCDTDGVCVWHLQGVEFGGGGDRAGGCRRLVLPLAELVELRRHA